MAPVIRPATRADLEPAMHVVSGSILDLRARHGIAVPAPPGATHFQQHCLGEDPTGLWVAEVDGAIQGFGFSWMCGSFWFLAQLFVVPGVQAGGVGQALLSRTLEQAARRGADNAALITLAYNRASTGLYIRNGMFPREPLYRIGAATAATRLPAPVAGEELRALDRSAPPPSWMAGVDQAVLGFTRQDHHALLLRTGLPGFAFERGGEPVGYAYVSPSGHVGPLAAAPGVEMAPILIAALRAAQASGAERLSAIVAGRAGPAMSAAFAAGLRIEEPYVLLATHAFGDWDRYAPMNPGYL